MPSPSTRPRAVSTGGWCWPCDVPPSLLTRGVLYTAITRARELLVVVGNGELLAQMTANDRQARRYSALRTRLLRELGEFAG